MDLRVHRMAYQIIPALLREWRMVSFTPWKVTPETAAVRIITRLGTTKSSDMESLIYALASGAFRWVWCQGFSFFAVFDRKVQCIAITRCNKYMYLIENH